MSCGQITRPVVDAGTTAGSSDRTVVVARDNRAKLGQRAASQVASTSRNGVARPYRDPRSRARVWPRCSGRAQPLSPAPSAARQLAGPVLEADRRAKHTRVPNGLRAVLAPQRTARRQPGRLCRSERHTASQGPTYRSRAGRRRPRCVTTGDRAQFVDGLSQNPK